MREIRFRAWHKKDKRMLKVENILFQSETYINNVIPINDVGLLQFTGVKDKNGNEIYEGDILRKVTTREGKKDFSETIKAVRWTPNRNGWNFTYGEQWEVIGNIYENPGLLKGKAR